MNTFQIQCFLTVADFLNFARAAEVLNVSQPAVTHQIKSLENELNVQLFLRSTRSVELTVEGAIFLEDAKQMNEIALRARNRFSTPEGQEYRSLSIGCGSFSQMEFLAEPLASLKALYPNLHPKLSAFPTVQLLAHTLDGSLDLALCTKCPETQKSSLSYRELDRICVVCLFPPGHRFQEADRVSLSDLSSENLIFCRPGIASPELAAIQGRLMETRRYLDLHSCDSAEAAMALALGGFGVSLLPDIFVPVHTPLPKCPVSDIPSLSFGCYFREEAAGPALKSFLKILRSRRPSSQAM